MKKFLKKCLTYACALVVLLPSLVLVGCKDKLNTNIVEAFDDYFYAQSLEYKTDFKIMQLADVQVHSIYECNRAFDKIDKLVEQERPDLIILTGDNVGGAKTKVHKKIIEHMEKYNILWATVFGNHDCEGDLEYKIGIADLYKHAKNCLFTLGAEGLEGRGNYIINIMDNQQIKFSLYLFDSNESNSNGYDEIKQTQIDWYRANVEKQTTENGGAPVSSLAFFHIPFVEFDEAIELYKNGQTTGDMIVREDVCHPYIHTNLFETMVELGSTKGVFVGHDHVNCGSVMYQGISLNYGLKSSKYSYYDCDLMGVTTITLKDDKTFTRQDIKF